MASLRLALRVTAAIAMLLALANPAWFRASEAAHVIILLDVSRSVSMTTRERHQQIVSAISSLAEGSLVSLIKFGATAEIVWNSHGVNQLSGTSEAVLADPTNFAIDARATDIAQALRLTQTIESDLPTHLVIISDAIETRGDASTELTRRRNAGEPLPYLLVLESPAASTTNITTISAPARVQPGESLYLLADIVGAPGSALSVAVQEDGRLLYSGMAEIGASQNTALRVPLRFETVGPKLIELSVGEASRNVVVNVSDRQSVLYVSDGNVPNLANSLHAGGWEVHHALPEELAAALAGFDDPGVVVLDNVHQQQPGRSGWSRLSNLVRESGVGLIVLGGHQAFGAGGYTGSDMETLLPVMSQAGNQSNVAAVLFVVDKSGSMGRDRQDLLPIDLAYTAVAGSVRMLGPGDEFGLIGFDIEPRVWLDLGVHRGSRAIERSWQGAASGGTSLAPALTLAMQTLVQSEASQKILVLVTDGFDGAGDIATLGRQLNDSGITTIALAIGEDPNLDVLSSLTGAKNDRLLTVNDITQLPRLMSNALGRERLVFEAGSFKPVVVEPVPFFKIDDAWPELDGILVTTARQSSDVYLASPEGDPVLAAHDAGFGRVVALPAGLGPYAGNWLSWPHWGEFSGGLVEWVGRNNGRNRYHIAIEHERANAKLVIESGFTETGLKDEAIQIRLMSPAGNVSELTANLVAPGRLVADLPTGQIGVHKISIEGHGYASRHQFYFEPLHEMQGSFTSSASRWVDSGLARFWSGRVDENAAPAKNRWLFLIVALVLYLAALLPERMLQSARSLSRD